MHSIPPDNGLFQLLAKSLLPTNSGSIATTLPRRILVLPAVGIPDSDPSRTSVDRRNSTCNTSQNRSCDELDGAGLGERRPANNCSADKPLAEPDSPEVDERAIHLQDIERRARFARHL